MYRLFGKSCRCWLARGHWCYQLFRVEVLKFKVPGVEVPHSHHPLIKTHLTARTPGQSFGGEDLTALNRKHSDGDCALTPVM